MEENVKGSPFLHRVVQEGEMPRVYLLSASEKAKASAKGEKPREPPAVKLKVPSGGGFFGHHIGKIMLPAGPPVASGPPTLEGKLSSAMETVRDKLSRIQEAYETRHDGRRDFLEQEKEKHRQFLMERNKAQEILFTDIVRCHQKFDTGLTPDDLWRLHDTLVMAASHEHHCYSGDAIHNFVECKLLNFIRQKSIGLTWQKLSAALDRLGLPFPFSPSLEEPDKPERNDMIRQGAKKVKGDELVAMSTLILAELILGNVPGWVYSYPEKGSYLWLTTVYQGVAAGMAADLYVNALSLWEKHAETIMADLSGIYTVKIDELNRKGQAASNLGEVLSVSKRIEQIAGEDIPEAIWERLSVKL